MKRCGWMKLIAGLAMGAMIADAASAAARPATGGAPAASIPSTWQYGGLGSNVGAQGAAFDQVGGALEMYASGTAGGYYWFALRYAADGSARAVYVSPLQPAAIVKVTLAHRVGRRPHIVVALASGSVLEYDEETKALVRTTTACTSVGGIVGFNTADLRGTGGDEFLSLCGNGMLVAQHAGSGLTAWNVSGVGGNELVAANFDGGSGVEIASNSGAVVGARKHKVQWNWTSGFGQHLQTVPLAGGRTGLVGETNGIVTAYDVANRVPAWTVNAGDYIGAMAVADVNGDGTSELIVGTDKSIEFYDVSTRALLDTMPARPAVTMIHVGKLRGTGHDPKLIWADGNRLPGPNQLYTEDYVKRKVVWTSYSLGGSFAGPATGDLSGTGHQDLVVVSSPSDDGNYYQPRIIVIDGKTLQLRSVSKPVCEGLARNPVNDVKVRDLGSGVASILIACDVYTYGEVEAWTMDPHGQFSMSWRVSLPDEDTPVLAVDASDIDGDGQVDVVASAASAVYAINGATGALEWQSLLMQSTPLGLAIGDFNRDGQLEVASQLQGGDVYILGGTGDVEAVIQDAKVTSVTTLQKGAGADLLLGTGYGIGLVEHYAYNGRRYVDKNDAFVGNGSIDSLLPVTLQDWWVGEADGPVVHELDGAAVGSTDLYGSGFGKAVAKLPKKDMVFSASDYGVFGFPAQP